ETDCGIIGSAEPFGPWRRSMSTSVFWIETMIELPEVREGGMSGRNEQRKPGTARESPMRSRTAKASRISRHAAKSRCACERDGWGRSIKWWRQETEYVEPERGGILAVCWQCQRELLPPPRIGH